MGLITAFTIGSFQAFMDFTGLLKALQPLVIPGIDLLPGRQEKHLIVTEIFAGLKEFPAVVLFEIIHVPQYVGDTAVVKYKGFLKPECIPELVDSSLQDASVEGKGVPDKRKGVDQVSFRLFLLLGGLGHFPDDLVKTGKAAIFKLPDKNRFPCTRSPGDYDAFGHAADVGQTKVRIPPGTLKPYLWCIFAQKT